MTEPDQDAETAATPPLVRKYGEWHLVEAHGYQVSIGPDSVVMLPRHVHPHDIPDLIAALTVAADVGNDIYTGNIEAGKNDDRSLAPRSAIVAEGGVPRGSVRMKVAQRQAEQATIGRATRRGRGAASSTPAAVTEKEPALTRQERARRARDVAKKAGQQAPAVRTRQDNAAQKDVDGG